MARLVNPCECDDADPTGAGQPATGLPFGAGLGHDAYAGGPFQADPQSQAYDANVFFQDENGSAAVDDAGDRYAVLTLGAGGGTPPYRLAWQWAGPVLPGVKVTTTPSPFGPGATDSNAADIKVALDRNTTGDSPPSALAIVAFDAAGAARQFLARVRYAVREPAAPAAGGGNNGGGNGTGGGGLPDPTPAPAPNPNPNPDPAPAALAAGAKPARSEKTTSTRYGPDAMASETTVTPAGGAPPYAFAWAMGEGAASPFTVAFPPPPDGPRYVAAGDSLSFEVQSGEVPQGTDATYADELVVTVTDAAGAQAVVRVPLRHVYRSA